MRFENLCPNKLEPFLGDTFPTRFEIFEIFN